MKYLKPVTWLKEDASQLKQSDLELRRKLIIRFLKSNRNVLNEITNALSSGDIKLAHRLAHNIKSNAGQLHKKLLQNAAEEIEINLSDGENLVSQRHLKVFENELNTVIAEFDSLVRELTPSDAAEEALDARSARKLLEELEPLLKDSDPECLTYIDSLKSISGSEELIRLIEDFDFKSALHALTEIHPPQP